MSSPPPNKDPATPGGNSFFANASGTYNGLTLNHVAGHQHNNQNNSGRIIENEGTYNENNNTANMQSLPEDIKAACDEYFRPVVIELVGCSQDAWKLPSSQELQTGWTNVMPDDKKGQFSQFGQAINKWVADVIVDWQDSIGNAALEMLEGLFKDLNYADDKKRKKYVTQQTSGNYWDHPYYYPSNSQQSNGQRTNIFQSPIVSKAFSEYFRATQNIPEDKRSKSRPIEALVLTILAIKWAFDQWSTGNHPGSIKKFSEDCQKIKHTHIRALFGKTQNGADRVSSELWNQIIAAAKSHVETPSTNTTQEDESSGLPPDLTFA
ncbi:hypothetical protein VKT23_015875 [Stygiomarasmius scandens]|uniref:DUF6532 domain-containing protein n=1 Tax=Marasmiellus scandens TaxID=2682957 RepID=A0ABR1IWY3_9AGAR